MKILILITIITWSFGGYTGSEKKQIVSSPEAAAVLVWEDKASAYTTEPDKKMYRLVEVDLQAKTIKDICIPQLEFKVSP
ncbi:MAG: hypothetical protein C4576_11400 [Desulfobacteraceae bacterium]|nr:MAG: hypothetical protein C4576_11400 [Desulfobacteraceae bacterium]